MTTPTTSLTCEADTSGRYSTRAHACGLPATTAFGWDGAMPVYRPVPRWVVRPEGVERSWDEVEVKVEAKDGWPASIELRAGSRLTRKQAIALAEALAAAAGGASDADCEGFVGATAWGACARCGRRLEDHRA